jgi:hypothetical protein
MSRYHKEYSPELKQKYFNILVSSMAYSLLEDDEDSQIELGEKSVDMAELIERITFTLRDHLDDEGCEYLDKAFINFEQEFYYQVETEDTLANLPWNKEDGDDDEDEDDD